MSILFPKNLLPNITENDPDRAMTEQKITRTKLIDQVCALNLLVRSDNKRHGVLGKDLRKEKDVRIMECTKT